MPDKESDRDMNALPVVGMIVDKYGPHAFSVVVLLSIWFTIVAPQLEMNAINYKEHHTVVLNLADIVRGQTAVATLMKENIGMVRHNLELTQELSETLRTLKQEYQTQN